MQFMGLLHAWSRFERSVTILWSVRPGLPGLGCGARFLAFSGLCVPLCVYADPADQSRPSHRRIYISCMPGRARGALRCVFFALRDVFPLKILVHGQHP